MQLAVAFGGSSLLSGSGLLKIGFLAASAVGSYLLGGKKASKASKLNDLKVSSSSYGKGIPIVWGTMRCAGNMIWATDIVEKKKYYNSKGKDITGKKKDDKKGQEVYEYFGNFAMAMCAGPVEEVLRIWADSNLIYDKYNPANEDLVGPGFSQGDDEDSGGKSGKSGGKTGGKKGSGDSGRFMFRFYNGTEEQGQDSFMVSKQGASMVPAYRGLCYIMFEDLALADFGNRIPTITAEVSVRKKQLINFATMQNGSEYVSGLINNTGTSTYFDPLRYRLYTTQRNSLSDPNGWILRTYDLSTMKEIKQTRFQDMGGGSVPSYNGLGHFMGMVNVSFSDIIGVAGNGDIVGVVNGASNSTPICFVDPQSYQIKSIFGVRSSSLNNGDGNIQYPRMAAPVAMAETSVGLDGSADTQPSFVTVVVCQFGNIYYFDNNNRPCGYINDSPVGTGGTPITGLPGLNSSYYYITENQSGEFGNTADRLWRNRIEPSARTVWNDLCVPSGMAMDIVGPSAGTCARQMQIANTFELVYETQLLDGEFGSLSEAFAIIGAECMGIFEQIQSSDPFRNGTYVVKIDPESNAVLWRMKVSHDRSDAPHQGNKLHMPGIITGNKFVWRKGNKVFEVDFRSTTMRSYDLPGGSPAMASGSQVYWAPRGALLHQINDPTNGNEVTFALAFLDRVTQVPASLKDICVDLCDRVGLAPGKADVTALNDETIAGYIMENPTSARQIIEDLSGVFMFDVVESDYTLKFVSRGQSPIVTITQDDLGIIDSGSDGQITNDYYKETIHQQIDLPERVVVSYINASDDYQTNTQHYKRPRSPMPVMSSRESLDINLPMALQPDAAKQMAQKVCMTVWAERATHDFVLPWTYAAYDPTDVAVFEMDNGLRFEDRLLKMDFGADYTIEAGSVAQSAPTYTSTATAAPGGGAIPVPRPVPPQTRPIVLDVPYLTDGDDVGSSQFVYYWGAAAYTAGFRYAAFESRLHPSDWRKEDVTVVEALWGSVIGYVPDPPHGAFCTDDQSTITLAPAHVFRDGNGNAFEWESIPENQWPSETNAVVIEDEVIYFRDVVENDNGTVTISHLLRGQRGTEGNAYGHSYSPEFVLVNEGLRDVKAGMAMINQTYDFRTRSPGVLISLSSKYQKNLTGASHKPYAPNDFRRIEAGGNITVTWQRRTRLNGALKNGTGVVPLSEEFEIYDAFILAGPFNPEDFNPSDPATYIRKFDDLTTNQLVYTSAMLSTDGKTLDDDVHIVVFQVSTAVGYGFPGSATLHHEILT